MAELINKKTTLFITASGSFLTPFMGSSVNIALPSMGRELAMDAILLSWVSTGYLQPRVREEERRKERNELVREKSRQDREF